VRRGLPAFSVLEIPKELELIARKSGRHIARIPVDLDVEAKGGCDSRLVCWIVEYTDEIPRIFLKN
jgi:hypothetical protein